MKRNTDRQRERDRKGEIDRKEIERRERTNEREFHDALSSGLQSFFNTSSARRASTTPVRLTAEPIEAARRET